MMPYSGPSNMSNKSKKITGVLWLHMQSRTVPTPFSLTYTLSWQMLLDRFSYEGNRGRYRFIELDMSTELDQTRNWNMLAKQVGQLAPGYWTVPFLAALFLIYAYAYLQISFRLDDYLITYVLVGV